MKKIGKMSMAYTFAGSFLGAGFVSGQELWQFFGTFGWKGFVGFVVALIILFAAGGAILYISLNTGITKMDSIVIRKEIPWLRTTVGVLECAVLICVPIIMAAGVGALMNQLFGINEALVGGIFCVLIAAVAFFGVSGVVGVFSTFVPPMIIVALVICAISFFKADFSAVSLSAMDKTNPLMGNWFTSAVEYGSYNMFCSVGILAPLALNIKKHRDAYGGIGIGCVFLLIIAFCVILAEFVVPACSQQELPMLSVSMQISSIIGIVYSVFLLGGMFGTSASSVFAVMTYIFEKYPKMERYKRPFILIIAVIVWVCSLAGFGNLISTVFPICGYFGFAVIICIFEHAIKVRKEKRAKAIQ